MEYNLNNMLERQHDLICIINPRRNADMKTSGIDRLFLQYRQNVILKLHPTHRYMMLDIADDWTSWYTQCNEIEKEVSEIMKCKIHPESKFARADSLNARFDKLIGQNRIISECCHDLFYISETEFLYMTAWYLRERGFKDLHKVYRKAAKQEAFLKENYPEVAKMIAADYDASEPEYFNIGYNLMLIEPCPFLNENGKCNCYRARPAICRVYGTASLCDCAERAQMEICLEAKEILKPNLCLNTEGKYYIRQARPLYYFFSHMLSKENLLSTLQSVKQFMVLPEKDFLLWHGKDKYYEVDKI